MLQYSRAMVQLACRTGSIGKSLAKQELLTVVASIFDFVWRTIETSIDSAKHNVKNALAKTLSLLHELEEHEAVDGFMRDLSKMDWRMRAKFSIIAVVVRDDSARVKLIKQQPGLPRSLLSSMKDPTILTHCVELYKVCLKEYKKDMDDTLWAETWIKPLLDIREAKKVDVHMGILTSALGISDFVSDFVNAEFAGKECATEEELLLMLALTKAKKKRTCGWKEYLRDPMFQRALNNFSDKVTCLDFVSLL